MNAMCLRRRIPINRRGATAVEMAIVAPVLLLIIFGFIQLGYAFLMQHVLQNAAREACRIAAMPKSTNAEVNAIVASSMQAGGFKKYTTTILIDNASGDVSTASANSDITVRVIVAAADATLIPGNAYFQYLTGPLVGTCSLRHE